MPNAHCMCFCTTSQWFLGPSAHTQMSRLYLMKRITYRTLIHLLVHNFWTWFVHDHIISQNAFPASASLMFCITRWSFVGIHMPSQNHLYFCLFFTNTKTTILFSVVLVLFYLTPPEMQDKRRNTRVTRLKNPNVFGVANFIYYSDAPTHLSTCSFVGRSVASSERRDLGAS